MSCVDSHRVAEYTFSEDSGGKKIKGGFKKGTPMNCDGELLWLNAEEGRLPTVTVKVMRQLVPVFARGPAQPKKKKGAGANVTAFR